MSGHQTIELAHVEALVNVPFELGQVLESASLVPLLQFVVEPALVFQELVAFFGPEELRDKQIDWVLIRLDLLVLTVRCLLLPQKALFSQEITLPLEQHFDRCIID